MGRAPCCEKVGLNRGPWTREEDIKLIQYIKAHGEGSWRTLPKAAGLLRCGKSCRLRWINYLRPDLKRGNITEEEDMLIIKLHSVLGNRWSLIAGRMPGRTDNEIKNYWNTHLKKKLKSMGIDPQTHQPLMERSVDQLHNQNITKAGISSTSMAATPALKPVMSKGNSRSYSGGGLMHGDNVNGNGANGNAVVEYYKAAANSRSRQVVYYKAAANNSVTRSCNAAFDFKAKPVENMDPAELEALLKRAGKGAPAGAPAARACASSLPVVAMRRSQAVASGKDDACTTQHCANRVSSETHDDHRQLTNQQQQQLAAASSCMPGSTSSTACNKNMNSSSTSSNNNNNNNIDACKDLLSIFSELFHPPQSSASLISSSSSSPSSSLSSSSSSSPPSISSILDINPPLLPYTRPPLPCTGAALFKHLDLDSILHPDSMQYMNITMNHSISIDSEMKLAMIKHDIDDDNHHHHHQHHHHLHHTNLLNTENSNNQLVLHVPSSLPAAAAAASSCASFLESDFNVWDVESMMHVDDDVGGQPHPTPYHCMQAAADDHHPAVDIHADHDHPAAAADEDMNDDDVNILSSMALHAGSSDLWPGLDCAQPTTLPSGWLNKLHEDA